MEALDVVLSLIFFWFFFFRYLLVYVCVCCILYPLFHVLNFGQIYCFKCALWIKICLRMYWEPKINYLTDSYLYNAVEALSWFMASFHLVVWGSLSKLMELQIQKSMIIFVSTIWETLDWQQLQFLIWQWSQICCSTVQVYLDRKIHNICHGLASPEPWPRQPYWSSVRLDIWMCLETCLKKSGKKKYIQVNNLCKKKNQKLTVKLRMSGFVTVLLTAIRKNHPNNTKI